MLSLLPSSWPRTPHIPMMILVLALLAVVVSANVEKAVFLGPPVAAADYFPGSLSESLSTVLPQLHRLTPDASASRWRAHLSAAFPWAADFEANSTTWVLLGGLQPGQRYEARVCWAATQPTAFDIDAFPTDVVQASPALSKSLASFTAEATAQNHEQRVSRSPATSILLLRIVAVANYVAANRSLMLPEHVQPLLVDVILDPFLFNVLPRSLAPTVALILVVATISTALSREIVRRLRSVAASGESRPRPRVTADIRQAKSKQI